MGVNKATDNGAVSDTVPMEEKVAVVGIGCRYPGGIHDVKDFWKILVDGVDCMEAPPADRFDPDFLYLGKKMPGKAYTKAAGFLDQDVLAFDRAFFKISPEEADYLDPQIRLLLEVVWESIQDAGIPADTLRGSSTGVYMGVMAREYTMLCLNPADNINQYMVSGSNSNMIANRVSYEFDLRGPSLSMDTACSSSMYAIYFACEAIRRGECEFAVAGGVNCNITPISTVGLCQAGMLSGHGKCKSFDEDAGGYARGEGAGVVFLKSLRKALEDGDRIYSVVRGGALNNDGRTTGITTPNPVAQHALLEKAYRNARVNPLEIPYVEAHGTGTRAGDRTEATAIGRVLGEKRGSEHPPLLIGSVKSNFGHTEGAAGAAGIIKASLVLRNREIPKVVHFKNRNSEIDWNKLNLHVPQELTKWPEGGKLLVGCSSFGFGGANAHIILEGAPSSHQDEYLQQSSPVGDKPLQVLTFSAATKESREELTSKWISFLQDVGKDYERFCDVIYTAALRSSHHKHRLCVIADSATSAADLLERKQSGSQSVPAAIVTGAVPSMLDAESKRLVFAFSGMGTQWWGMGRQLFQENKTFRESIMKIDKLLSEFGADWSLVELYTTETDNDKINITDIAQPAICALQMSLVQVYKEWGIIPDAIVGHSVGEVAAAYCAGYLSMEDAVKLIFTRGKQMRKTKGFGGMVAVLHDVQEVQVRVQECKTRHKIDVACINSPSQIVLSGDTEALNEIVETFKKEGIRCRPLKVQNAFHSFQQEAVKESFLEEAKFLNPNNARDDQSFIPMMSTVTNHYLDHETTNNPEYWYSNIRQTVFFKSAMDKLVEDGFRNFLEIGAHPALMPAIKDIVSQKKSMETPVAVFSSLKRPKEKGALSNDMHNLLESVSRMHVAGLPVDVALGKHTSITRQVESLPKYAWQRVVCSAITTEMSDILLHPPKIHPILGKRLHTSLLQDDTDLVWNSSYSPNTLPWLRHHQIENVAVLPGAAFIETMLEAAKQVTRSTENIILTNIEFQKFHFAPEGRGQLETTVRKLDDNKYRVCISSFNSSKNSWITHATAFIESAPTESTSSLAKTLCVTDLLQDCSIEVGREEFYKNLSQNGVQLGDTFASVTTAHFAPIKNDALVFSTLPEILKSEEKTFNFHPALLDSTFQSLVGSTSFKGNDDNKDPDVLDDVKVPKSVGKMIFRGMAPAKLIVQTIDKSESNRDIVIADEATGEVFASMLDVKLERIDRTKEKLYPEIWQRDWVRIDENDSLQTSESEAYQVCDEIVKQKKMVLIADETGVSKCLDSLLNETCDVEIIRPDVATSKDDQLDLSLLSADHVIILSPLNLEKSGDFDTISKSSFLESQSSHILNLAALVRKLQANPDHIPTVWVVTRGAKAVDEDDVVNPLMSSVHAFGITMMHEEPNFHVTSVDLPLNQTPEESALWLKRFLHVAPKDENEFALRHETRLQTTRFTYSFSTYALRVGLTNMSKFGRKDNINNWQLQFSKSTKEIRTSVKIEECAESEPVMETNADIIVKLQALSVAEYFDPVTKKENYGYIYGGHVTSLHDNSPEEMGVDNRLLGYQHSDQAASSIKTKSSDTISIPHEIDTKTAVQLLKTYLPYYIALEHVNAGKRKKVLVCQKNSDKSTMLAITKMAASFDYEVSLFTEEEGHLCDYLADFKMDVLNKKELEFKVPDGSIDLLIIPDYSVSSKTSKLIFKKMRMLGTVARLVERDENMDSAPKYWDNLPLNIFSFSIDMKEMWSPPNHRIALQQAKMLLENVNKTLNSNRLPISETLHVSKVLDIGVENDGECLVDCDVISIEECAPVHRSFEYVAEEFQASSSSSYLVTGGTKGLGVQVVTWLVSRGAKSIYVTGRNEPTGEAASYFRSVTSQGVQVHFVRCNVDKEEEMRILFEKIADNESFPLEGVFHCAAVFRNVYLVDETQESWDAVLSPKAYGALLIHQLTQSMNISLKYFVLFSSILEYLGNEGQASYTAANYFLSMLCHARRTAGLPATTILPGTIGAVGYAARQGYGKLWQKKGMVELEPADVLKTVSWLLVTERSTGGITAGFSRKKFFKMNYNLFGQHFKTDGGNFSTYKKEFRTREEFDASAGEDGSSDLITQIGLKTEEEAKKLITQVLSDYIMLKLGIEEESIEGSLVNLGIDSLMSSEFSNMIDEKFGATVKAMELLNDKLNVGGLSSIIYKRLTAAKQ